MAKITAEARKHLISRTSVTYRATVRTFSMKDGTQGEMTVNVSGDFNSEMDMLAYIASRNTTSETAVVPVAVKPVEKLEDRRVMFDDDFMRHASVVQDGDRLQGLMVRTLKLSIVKAVKADFKERKFYDETLYVVGTYDSGEEAIAWYKKRTPKDTGIYGEAVIDSVQEARFAMPVETFYEHSFSVNAEE